MATSLSYTFQDTPGDNILREAFERAGVTAQIVTGEQVQSTIASLNYMLADWINRGANISTMDQEMVTIVPGQPTYSLPEGISDILATQMIATTLTRPLDGTPFSSAGGVAENAFDDDLNTSCTQTAADGYISYDFGADVAYPITYIGVLSETAQTYTLAIEYSFDNATWNQIYTPRPLSYTAGITRWIVPKSPVKARYWRIRETGGATLDITELYFSVPDRSINMSRFSRDWYLSVPNKLQTGVPSAFWVDRSRNPNFTVWLAPDDTYDAFVFNVQRYYPDMTELLENVDVPQRFMEAMVSGLAARISQKYFPDRFQLLQSLATEAYQHAARSDVDVAPMKINVFN